MSGHVILYVHHTLCVHWKSVRSYLDSSSCNSLVLAVIFSEAMSVYWNDNTELHETEPAATQYEIRMWTSHEIVTQT